MGAQGFYLFPSHYLPNYKVNEMRREGAIKKDEEATLIMLVTFQLGIVYIHVPKNLDKPHKPSHVRCPLLIYSITIIVLIQRSNLFICKCLFSLLWQTFLLLFLSFLYFSLLKVVKLKQVETGGGFDKENVSCIGPNIQTETHIFHILLNPTFSLIIWLLLLFLECDNKNQPSVLYFPQQGTFRGYSILLKAGHD